MNEAKDQIPVWESSDGTQIDREQFAQLENKYGAARVCMKCRTTHFFNTEVEAIGTKCGECGGPLKSEAEIVQEAKRQKRRADKALARLQGFTPSMGNNRRARRAKKARARRKAKA